MYVKVIMLDDMLEKEFREKVNVYFTSKFYVNNKTFDVVYVSDIDLYIKIYTKSIIFSSGSECENKDAQKNFIKEVISELFLKNEIAVKYKENIKYFKNGHFFEFF